MADPILPESRNLIKMHKDSIKDGKIFVLQKDQISFNDQQVKHDLNKTFTKQHSSLAVSNLFESEEEGKV